MMQKISWTDGVRTEEVLHRVNENKKTQANWIGHILRRNCLLEHIIIGKIEEGMEVTERQRRRREQLLDNRKEIRECWKLKEKTLHRTVWGTRLGRGNGSVVRLTTV